MKLKIVASGAAVIFSLAILVMSIFAAVDPMRVYTAEMGGLSTQSGVRIEYYLPYPGILPDNKLYAIKMVRDRVRLWLTFGDEKKVARELEYADKRLGAAVALIEGGKKELGVRTYTKAEKYLESAVSRTMKMSSLGLDVKSWLLTLSKAAAKHAELGVMLSARLEGDEKVVFEQAVRVTQVLGERLEQALREAR